jgi:hypothetical protein
MTALFLGQSDGPFAFHPVETAGGEFMDLPELERHRAEDDLPMTPALVAALDAIFRLRREGILEMLLAEL